MIAQAPPAAVTAATDWSDHHNRELARRLGCHRPARTKRCTGNVNVQDFTLALKRVSGGAPCATGKRVLQRIEDRVPEHSCSPRLCLTEGGSYAGFRCHSVYAGDDDWRLVCRRGRAEIAARASR